MLHTKIQVKPENATKITKGCLVLHNIMRTRYPNLQNEELDDEVDGVIVPGSWRDAGVLVDCEQEAAAGVRSTRKGRHLRQYLMHYVNGATGSVPWQEAAIQAPIN